MANTKEQVLRFLENSAGKHISGEKLAQSLGVSRNAIWKAVRSLRAEGFDIQAVTNRGYCLVKDADSLSAHRICSHLPESHPFHLVVRSVVGSTNTEGRRWAAQGAKEGTVIVAEEQTNGRGRVGKSFFSPPRTGLYLSIVLRPSIRADQAQFLTTMAAVACARAIESVTDQHAGIKWVNDIYCNDSKVAGILTEGSVDMESGLLEYAVLGVGINVREPEKGFPQEISERAGSLEGQLGFDVPRNLLAAAFLKEFWALYTELPNRNYYEEYRRRCFVLGSHVIVKRGNRRLRAKAVDLTKDFELVIELPDKTRAALPFGEISAPAPPNR
ncbi:biotin--[acetyl-CoA-carboxylase] ligase [Xiamenia xianingshaonis]|uniref:Bifunctional ligase/repressor BirA n=1 Tax=Xiamenia xianingshaonis TaxID=2682776 RepID=A0A9E6MPG8_9ACTN|nr:biotin--[acetyl-CoA-carboxylase] ligase [Xiamenia xianingshaonis]NGM17867.1 biotin--[acetyl-CoA-carboxylase] ligase [Eggerthellaceae bacterium zg-893]NHM14109.1 biotin--[acetyl-CoA-carboxylase] ligase [Xiamenia xianingshaonis]NHM16278.1 biotin--[acetyl-CoA-carboxylase] ligase [Xiamenia xianingshaonis]QTU83972.1 biotin--[acetyl-CoA-carboxylase] ligase [Xiamenia xianingshaonis]